MRTTERLRLSLSLPCFYAAESAAGVQFITVMYHLLRGKEGVRGGEGGARGDENNAHAKVRT